HHPAITSQHRVSDLPLAARQIVEICRALAQRASLILMDEPTSSLQRADVDRLFSLIRRLRESGISIIYISHFLEEVREIADMCTGVGEGKSGLGGPIRDLADERLITAMVGRSVKELFPARSPATVSECVLEVKNLAAPPVREASVQLRRGEIF